MHADQVIRVPNLATLRGVAVGCSGEVFCSSKLRVKGQGSKGNVENSVLAGEAIRVALSSAAVAGKGLYRCIRVYHGWFVRGWGDCERAN